ncbi:MAG: metallophosphoesterase [Pirellula sp.]|jgi:UDP-2,3-diacylglucosamine hydrolase
MKFPRAHFISDLHLFSKRSSGPRVQGAIEAAVSQSETFVLGGDIFDFRWSALDSHEKTVEQSIRWLKGLLSVNPDCHFHYILGNHDALPAFTQQLDQLALANPKLQWHKHYLRLKQAVFLHGDIIDARIPYQADFHELLDERRIAHEHRPRPHPMRHALYDAVVKTRIHRLVAHVANSNEKVLARVSSYLQWAGQTPQTGAEQVYFGHTHRPVDALGYQGQVFYNPGAAIRGIPFRILPIEL